MLRPSAVATQTAGPLDANLSAVLAASERLGERTTVRLGEREVGLIGTGERTDFSACCGENIGT